MLSTYDEANLASALAKARSHSSGGSYDMVAFYAKGARRFIGLNRLNRPATTLSRLYPPMLGAHCEADLMHRNPDLERGTVYVVGKNANSGVTMQTTKPCFFCAQLLNIARISFVVFYEEGIPCKARINSLSSLSGALKIPRAWVGY